MATPAWGPLAARLRASNISFDDGLTDAEVAAAEARFAVRFPPNMRRSFRQPYRVARRIRPETKNAPHSGGVMVSRVGGHSGRGGELLMLAE
jgi:cell wall assembly regulator SMI1